MSKDLLRAIAIINCNISAVGSLVILAVLASYGWVAVVLTILSVVWLLAGLLLTR